MSDFNKSSRLGVMSDTHGSLPAWLDALMLFGSVEAVLHAGDVLYHGPRNAIPGGYKPQDLADAIHTKTGVAATTGAGVLSDLGV